MGVKIVTLAGSGADDQSSKSAKDSASMTSSLSSLSMSHRSSTSSSTAFEPPQSLSSAQSTTPRGSLTLFDKNGAPRALLNAEEITAFRTALASTMLFKKRQNVHDVVVFGAGKQAYWHIRLALLLRGPDIHHLNIINRDFERVHQLLSKLYAPNEESRQWDPSEQDIPQYRANSDTTLAHPKIQILTPGHGEYERLLKSTIRSSSVIFFTTPSLTPLFPAPYLTNPEGRKKGRYLAAIGSYKPHMVEIHPDILKQNVAPEHGHRHFHKHAPQGGAVVVDSVEACLKEAGEIIQAGLGPNEVVEIGELLMLKRDAERRRLECHARKSEEGLDEGGVELGECEKSKKKRRGSKEKDGEGEDKAHKSLVEWLQRGNVIYKSVGLGLMDVVVGMDLVRLADERGIGIKIENF
jgi:ornithine cyclodeaminase/alanine dehydrogenase-like protein (mu-crystallin family)